MLRATPGRRPNIYGHKPADFDAYWKTSPRYEKPVIEAPFGMTAYVFNKGLHFFRVSFTPADAESQFFWTRITSPDEEFDFVIPAFMHIDDLPRVIELWELDDETTRWNPGALASPSLPKGWRIHGDYAPMRGQFFVLMHNLDEKTITLEARAGLHTLTREKERLAGIIGSPGDLNVFRKLPASAPDVKVNTPLEGEALFNMRMLSAHYFRKVLLTPGKGRVNSHIPHYKMLSFPQVGITELFL